jgi:nitrate/nitrite transporter NarK
MTLVGGSLRFFGGYSLAFFKPTYFLEIYPTRDSDVSVINAVMASVLCFISALAGGILSDKYHENKMTKAYICILSSLISAPALAICFYKQDNFTLSVSMLGINYLFAEAWGSPAITMLMDSTSP